MITIIVIVAAVVLAIGPGRCLMALLALLTGRL